MAPVTLTLLIANVAASLLQQAEPGLMLGLFALWPLHARDVGQPTFAAWQLVTYSFLHGGLSHLFFNMLALYMFGSDIERLFGSRRFGVYYFASVLAAAVTQLTFAALTNSSYPTVGASGGIFGVLLAFGLFFPRRMVMLVFPPIPMPAWLFVTLYGALELFLGVTGTQQGVAHFAHLGGMLGGWLTLRYWRARTPLR